MGRGKIQRSGILYSVIDTRFSTIVLMTESLRIAESWRARVDRCEHDFPYDILDHDRKVNSLKLSKDSVEVE